MGWVKVEEEEDEKLQVIDDIVNEGVFGKKKEEYKPVITDPRVLFFS